MVEGVETGGVEIGPQGRRDVRVDWEVVAQTARICARGRREDGAGQRAREQLLLGFGVGVALIT